MAIPWHRIFGMALTQYFAGTAWQVDVEIDLSLQQQRLDIAVLRHARGTAEPLWPDGFGDPAEYNLFTFKAFRDPLNAFALKELAGHGVNYRKYVSPDLNHLLPESCFRLYAATMHFPQQLANQIDLTAVGLGAYDVKWGTDTIRILVMPEMPDAEQNLVWNLFSGKVQQIASAFKRIQPRLHSYSSLVNELLNFYGLEGMAMPYTMEDFERDAQQNFLEKLTPDQLLARLSPDQLLACLSPDQLLARLSPEQLLERLTAKQRLEGLPVERFLEALPLDEIENFLKKQKALQDKNNDPPKPSS